MSQPRPASIVITQILMLLSLIPMAVGLTYALVSALIADPSQMLSLRALVFLVVASGLTTSFLVFGFGGLWRRKRYGYWLGLVFLAALTAKNIYTFAPHLSRSVVGGQESPEFTPLSSGYGSEEMMFVSIAVQGLVTLLILILLLKVALGKKEKRFFDHSLEAG